MSKKKETKVHRFKMMSEGDVTDYQAILEECIGQELSTLRIYDANWEGKKMIGGREVQDKDRAYLVADADYYITITKIQP